MTWNPSIPAVANLISADYPDIVENFAHLSISVLRRSVVTYNGGSTAYTVTVGPGIYHCKDKVAYWASTLTTDAIGSPSASTEYFLYLDYSAIVSGTLVTASELVWSSTAPTWDDDYRQWMNGDDTCIFRVKTNSTPDNILEFFHDGGDYVDYGAQVSDYDADLDTTWTDVTLSIPSFSTKALVTFYLRSESDSTTGLASYRPNGSALTGHVVAFADDDAGASGTYAMVNSRPVMTDSSQKIEVKMSADGDHLLKVYTNGYYLPTGM